MLDSSDLIKAIKQAATDAVEANEPTNWMYGTVVSESPLRIQIDQKITLEEIQLTLTRNCTEWTEEVEIDWNTLDKAHSHPFTGDGSVQDTTLNYQLKGKYNIKHLTKLKAGENVILLQQAGGQHYVVLDRV